jgi:twinkle protein
LVNRYGIQFLYINPWNWVDHNREPGISETEYVSISYTKLIRFARMYGVHIFNVAHTTKMEKDLKTGKYKIPSLYNINGSTNFYNKTHNGVCVYRDFETGMVDVYNQKVKQSWNGETGWSSYTFDTMIRKYNFVNSSILDKKVVSVNIQHEPEEEAPF